MKHFAILVALFCFTHSLAAQSFDERISDWPTDLKINGSVIANSGRGAIEQCAEHFIRAAGGEKAQLVEIRFGSSSFDGREWFEIADSYAQFEIAGNPTAEDQRSNDLTQRLESASGVWLEADQRLTRQQRKMMVQTLENQLRKVIARQGVVYAGNEIAPLLGKHEIIGGQMFGDQRQATINRGLNIIPDVVMAGKFDFQNDLNRARLLSVLAAHRRTVGIGIENDTAIVLAGRKIQALGQGSATFFTMANQRQPLRVKTIRQRQAGRANPADYMVDLTGWRRDAIERTLEVFPPEIARKPHVDNGTLVIVGGGGLPDGLMERFLELAGGKDAKLVYVPCSESDKISPRSLRLVDAWKEQGLAANVIHTKDRNRANSDEEFLAPLKDATGIWFGGGRQWNFADSYYGTKAHKLMKDVLKRGGVIGGSSAGASIQARYLARATPINNVQIMAPGYQRGGLGFIGGVAIDQHFSQRGRQKDMTQLVNRYPQLLGIGIDESTALVVKKSTAEVVGRGQVFFYDRQQHKPWHEPDYLALAAGQSYDLAKRSILETEPSRDSKQK